MCKYCDEMKRHPINERLVNADRNLRNVYLLTEEILRNCRDLSPAQYAQISDELERRVDRASIKHSLIYARAGLCFKPTINIEFEN